MSEAQVKARFFTKEQDAALHAPAAPLFVPTSLKRYGLLEVVNHVLPHEDPVPLDFLIDGVLLRLSLDEYLTAHGLSSEATLEIEYTRAVLPPSFLASYNADDWVSSVATRSGPAAPAGRPQIAAGAYDGVVRSYNASGQVEAQYVGHLAPVRAVCWAGDYRLASAGNDRAVRLWKTAEARGESGPALAAGDDADDADDVPAGRTVAVLAAHTAPVVDLAVLGRRLLSAGSDGAVGLWLTVPKEMQVVEPWAPGARASLAQQKRRRMALRDAAVPHRAPLALLEGHAQPVEGVAFDGHDASVAYSVAQDHTVRTWDLATGRCVDTRRTGYALLAVAHLAGANLVALGSSARHVNLHDPRTHEGATERSVAKLVGHTNFVVSVAACPDSDTMFASASHDGTVKVWDVRADRALYTITRESGLGKVFGVAWDAELGIVLGGEDKRIQINSSPGSQK